MAYFTPQGVYLLGVRRPGNAHDSGLRRGDIILTIDGQPIPSFETMRNLYRTLTRLAPGKRTTLIEVLRQGYYLSIVLDFNRDRNALK